MPQGLRDGPWEGGREEDPLALTAKSFQGRSSPSLMKPTPQSQARGLPSSSQRCELVGPQPAAKEASLGWEVEADLKVGAALGKSS